eukprot:2143720-Rhodomonas_salina.8
MMSASRTDVESYKCTQRFGNKRAVMQACVDLWYRDMPRQRNNSTNRLYSRMALRIKNLRTWLSIRPSYPLGHAPLLASVPLPLLLPRSVPPGLSLRAMIVTILFQSARCEECAVSQFLAGWGDSSCRI